MQQEIISETPGGKIAMSFSEIKIKKLHIKLAVHRLVKENLYTEIESLIKAIQNNSIRINYANR